MLHSWLQLTWYLFDKFCSSSSNNLVLDEEANKAFLKVTKYPEDYDDQPIVCDLGDLMKKYLKILVLLNCRSIMVIKLQSTGKVYI